MNRPHLAGSDPTGDICDSSNPRIATLAAVVIQIAIIAPYKKRRFRILRRVAPHLMQALVDQGVVEPIMPFEDFEEIMRLDGWIPEHPAGEEVVPDSSGAALREDVLPF